MEATGDMEATEADAPTMGAARTMAMATTRKGQPPQLEATGMAEPAAYGLWFLVVLNSALFILFAFSFSHPRSKRDWRAFGGYSAFIIALFTEMYGVPLTIYLLSGWLLNRYPNLDVLTHNTGHLWSTLIGWPYDPHFSPFHIASYVALAYGFILLARAWPILLKAQRSGTMATTGPYARIRHPQYAGFLLIMLGFLLQWPTLITLAMFPNPGRHVRALGAAGGTRR